MQKRVSGLRSETKRIDPVTGEGVGEVVRYEKGDIVYFPQSKTHAQLVDIQTNERGNRVMKFGFPMGMDFFALQRWAEKNPHKVKVMVLGHHVDDDTVRKGRNGLSK